MTDLLKGAIAESSDNKTYTDNIKKTLQQFDLVDGFLSNLITDKDGVQNYLDSLRLLKGRGFKVDNAMARLEYQLEQTQVSIESFTKQKVGRLRLLAMDIIDVSENVLKRRLIIDDRQRLLVEETHKALDGYRNLELYDDSSINKLVSLSLSHMSDLSGDVGKFDAQIEEAKSFAARNFDIGDLVGDLRNQKYFNFSL